MFYEFSGIRKMITIIELQSTLQKLKNRRVSFTEIGKALGTGRSNISKRVSEGSKIKDHELIKIEQYFNVELSKQNNKNVSENDIIKIPYWSDLPEELKHKEYSYVLAQRVSIEQGWNLKPESLCITVMNGDTMENYWYKIRNNDVLIVDTNETKVNANGSGVYFATSRNNTMFWIREMQALYNGDIEFYSYAPSGVKTKVLTQQQLFEADFKIIGKVIKNVSFRL